MGFSWSVDKRKCDANDKLYFPAFQPENRISVPALDTVVTPDDVRYFTNETDDIANLEASVLENPSHVQLWLKLAYKYLNQNEG